MNTNFIDISASVSPLAQNGLGPAGAGSTSMTAGTGRDAGTDQKFEERFQKEVNRLGAAADKGSKTKNATKNSSTRENSEVQKRGTADSDTRTDGEATAGLEFLSKLEQLLNRISGGDLKGTMVDSQGLDALKMLLVKAGFDSDEVDGIVAGLKEKSKTKTLSLDEVLDSLSDLVVKVDEKASPEAVYMESSALPFLKEMLNSLDLTDGQIDAIVEEADQGTSGISLDVIIQNLKSLEAAYREGGKTLTIEDGDGSFRALMARLNLPGADTDHETLSINDLIRSFEDYKQQKEGEDGKSASLAGSAKEAGTKALSGQDAGTAVTPSGNKGGEQVSSLLNSFFQSLSTSGEDETSSFSYHQVKDQFVNEMMIPGKTDQGKKGLFSPQEVKGDAKSEQLIKELTTLATENSGTSSGKKEGLAEGLGRERHRELSKTDTLFQGSGNTGNSGSDIGSSGSASRAKAAPRTLPAYVTHQVGRGIVRAVNQGESTLRLQLKPPELGRLTMTIDHHSTGVKVSIVTENHAARDLLASNVNELKSALNSAGISLDSFDVDMNSDFGQSMANAGNQAGQFGKRNGSRQGSGFSAQGSGAGDDLPISASGPVIDGSYHFVA